MYVCVRACVRVCVRVCVEQCAAARGSSLISQARGVDEAIRSIVEARICTVDGFAFSPAEPDTVVVVPE